MNHHLPNKNLSNKDPNKWVASCRFNMTGKGHLYGSTFDGSLDITCVGCRIALRLPITMFARLKYWVRSWVYYLWYSIRRKE